MADINKALDKIEHILVTWYNKDAIMLSVWCRMKKVADPNQETIGLDTAKYPPTLRYNPNFINSIHKEYLEAIMVSEGLKLLLRHPTTRLIEPRHISSLSSTITVNQSIMTSMMDSKVGDAIPSYSDFDMPKDSFFEDYFRRLIDNQSKVDEKINQMWNDMSDEEKQSMIDGSSGQGEDDQDSGSESSKSGNQEGQGDGKDDQCYQDGFKNFGSAKEAVKEYFNPKGTASKDWSENNMVDSEIQNMIREKRGTNEGWGKFTGSFRAEIISANEPKYNWKDIVRLFKKSIPTASTQTSRMKYNRRYGLKQPGRRYLHTCKIIFAVDVSGSMSDEDLAEGFAVINKICRHAEITYVLFDTEIKLIEKKMKKAKDAFVLNGRGGTYFQPVVDLAEEMKADGLVIYTDGESSAPTQPQNMQTLWLFHAKEAKRPHGCDWGYEAHLDRYESH